MYAGSRVVVVTGVPGAGKSTLARALAPVLGAEVLSLDALKEELYADDPSLPAAELRARAEQVLASRLDSGGRAVVDIWVAPGRDTARCSALLTTHAAGFREVLCRVPAEVAVARYAARVRGGPHLPADDAMLERIRRAAAGFVALTPDPLVVDTSRPVDVPALGALLES